MARRQAVADGKETVVVHRLRGTERAVLEQYHRDVDAMGWQGYVEVSHTLEDVRLGWKALVLNPQKEIVVTYRRLD